MKKAFGYALILWMPTLVWLLVLVSMPSVIASIVFVTITVLAIGSLWAGLRCLDRQ